MDPQSKQVQSFIPFTKQGKLGLIKGGDCSREFSMNAQDRGGETAEPVKIGESMRGSPFSRSSPD